MKKYFLTGLVILLPLALTLAIVAFVFNFLTEPFVGLVQSIMGYFGLLETGFFFIPAQQLQVGVSKIIILALLFFFTISLGMLGRWFFFHYVLKFWDYAMHRIPFVNTIYRTSQDVIQTLFASETSAFKQVVMVPFPSQTTYTVGFLTQDQIQGLTENFVSIFIPTTPNPTSGFLVLYKREDIIYLDMSVENAFKFIISCGVIASPMKSLTYEKSSNETIKA